MRQGPLYKLLRHALVYDGVGDWGGRLDNVRNTEQWNDGTEWIAVEDTFVSLVDTVWSENIVELNSDS
jgi:hypothetical protein